MPTFPKLKTGAVAQYPAQRKLAYSTEVLRFVDGSEQRFPDFGVPARSWTIRLNRLSSDEAARIERFYAAVQGEFGSFSFVDPWTEIEYPDCSFENPLLEIEMDDEQDTQTSLIVRNNLG